MGANCSIPGHCAAPNELLLGFTTWTLSDVEKLGYRYSYSLDSCFSFTPDTFQELVQLPSKETADRIFTELLDTDKNGLVDAYETISVVVMLSALTGREKIEFLVGLYDYAKTGLLTYDDIFLLVRSIVYGVAKVEPTVEARDMEFFEGYSKKVFLNSKKNPEDEEITVQEFMVHCSNDMESVAFLQFWSDSVRQQNLSIGGLKWTDPEFPASNKSLYFDPARPIDGYPPVETIEWLRPYEIMADPPLLFGELPCEKHAIRMGHFYHASTVAALASISTCWPALQKLFVKTGQEAQGRFGVRLYANGQWRIIYLDDQLPILKSRNPLFNYSANPSEYWVMLLEKALAKVFGCYEALLHLDYDSLMYALTGNRVARIESPIELCDLEDMLAKGPTAGIASKKSSLKFTKIYSIIRIAIIEEEHFVELCDPYGEVHLEDDPVEELNDTDLPERGLIRIPFTEWNKSFDVALNCDLHDQEKGWKCHRVSCCWPHKGGGTLDTDSWVMNPQIALEIHEETIVSLVLDTVHPCLLSSAFDLKADDAISLAIARFDWKSLQAPKRMVEVYEEDLVDWTREFQVKATMELECVLTPGRYTIIPLQYRKNYARDFCLTLWLQDQASAVNYLRASNAAPVKGRHDWDEPQTSIGNYQLVAKQSNETEEATIAGYNRLYWELSDLHRQVVELIQRKQILERSIAAREA